MKTFNKSKEDEIINNFHRWMLGRSREKTCVSNVSSWDENLVLGMNEYSTTTNAYVSLFVLGRGYAGLPSINQK